MPVRQQAVSSSRLPQKKRRMREQIRVPIQPGRYHAIVLCAAVCVFWGCGAARAEDASSWRDIETKYIFGFTTGSGIGLEGEKEFTVDAIGRFGKRDGHYAATETKYEFEFTPSQFIQIEFGALGSTHNIGGVTDLDDRRQVALIVVSNSKLRTRPPLVSSIRRTVGSTASVTASGLLEVRSIAR